jgi:epoxide hydrolase-like predicted phosphatase
MTGTARDDRARRSEAGPTGVAPVRAVISDFGGVLTTPLVASFAAYQRRSGVTPEQLGQAMAQVGEQWGGRHPLHELECGRITEDHFLRSLEAELGGDVQMREFGKVFFDALEPNEEMIALMRDLRRRGYRTALLTNNVREWEPRWRSMLPEIDEIFEVIVDSAFVGVRKPEPKIYELTVERLGGGLRPEECLFIDDMELNCEAARELGMRAVRFDESSQTVAEVQAALG